MAIDTFPDDYARPKTAKGDARNVYPFNVKKTQPPPPPATLLQPAPSGETPNE